MNRTTFQSYWVRIAGILIILIGVMHDISTPGIYQRWLDILPQNYKSRALGMAFFFAVAGAAVIFAGLLMLYASIGLRKSEGWARVIGLGASLFTGLFGITAMAVGFNNPLVWVMMVAAIASVIVLLVGHL